MGFFIITSVGTITGSRPSARCWTWYESSSSPPKRGKSPFIVTPVHQIGSFGEIVVHCAWLSTRASLQDILYWMLYVSFSIRYRNRFQIVSRTWFLDSPVKILRTSWKWHIFWHFKAFFILSEHSILQRIFCRPSFPFRGMEWLVGNCEQCLQ